METLDLNKLQKISGGGFGEGFCIGIGIVGVVALFSPISPVGAGILGGISGACTAYSLANVL